MTELYTNQHIIDQFNLLIKQILFDIDYSSGKMQMINMFRLRSIKTALKGIKEYRNKITKSSDLKGIKGIGKGTLDRVDEILKTGKLSEIKVSNKDKKYLDLVEQLEEIYGIGRKKAYELFMKYDIKSIADLKKKYDSGEIILPDNISKGLKYFEQIKDNIPREEIDSAYLLISSVILSIDIELFSTICGSYRRLNPTSGDIDIIIVHPKIKTKKDAEKSHYLQIIIKKLKETKFIIDSLTGDDVQTKYMGLFKLKHDLPLRRIDIRFIPYESYYSAILYFTGSKDFNKKMRRVALDSGYTLNEYGLFDENDNMFKVNSEKDIFDLLGIEYLTPDKRK